VAHLEPSPALAQINGGTYPVDGRIVDIVAGPDADLAGIAALRTALESVGAVARVIAPVGGELGSGKKLEIVERTYDTARSVEFDAVVIADGAPKQKDIKAVVLLHEAYRQLKAFGAWGDGAEVLTAAGIDVAGPGVLTADSGKALAADLVAAMGMHKVWERAPLVMASAVPPVV
jgi:catalase